MRIAFKTFGCRANSTDTDVLYLEAKRRGFQIVEETDPADAYVINSCTVTANADRDARLQANRFKRQNPGSLVAVIGCYAQVAKEELLALPEVDFVVGTANKFRILDHFTEAFEKQSWQRDQVEVTSGFLPVEFQGSRHSRATIKIQDGCNFNCSFCIIPQARGRSRSLSIGEVVHQVQTAYEQGFQEVVLTGIHIAHYGWDRGTDLMTLVERLLQGEGPRIRLSTLDPFEIPDSLIALLGSHPRLCPHLHIAIQSGSDKVLKAMRRIYAAREFTEVTQKIKIANPNTFIGVDVIVGFPGEGEDEFQETVTCLENSFWTKLHVFPFSLRKGTRAETLSERVPAAIIAQRSRQLRELSDKRYASFLTSQVGRLVNVIVEKPSRRQKGYWQGHTENYLPTLSLVSQVQSKSLVPSKIVRSEGDRILTTAI